MSTKQILESRIKLYQRWWRKWSINYFSIAWAAVISPVFVSALAGFIEG